MDGLDCVVRLSLTFLYLLLSANLTLWIPLSSIAVDDVRELLLALWLLYLVSVSIAGLLLKGFEQVLLNMSVDLTV